MDGMSNTTPSNGTGGAASSDGDSAAVGVRAHSRPSRASRSDREVGKPAKPSTETRVAGRTPPVRGAGNEATDSDKMRETLARSGDDAEEGNELHDASGREEAAEELEPTETATEEATEDEAAAPLKAAQEQLQAAEARYGELRGSAQKVLRENQLMTKKLAFFEQALGEALKVSGMELDPRALKLMEMEAERDLDGELKGMETEQQKADYAREVDSEIKRYTAEVNKAAKATGIDNKQLARRYATAMSEWMDGGKNGAEPTLDDVVDEIKTLSARKQAKTSQQAPQLARSNTANTVAKKKNPNTFAGWSQTLREHGHAD